MSEQYQMEVPERRESGQADGPDRADSGSAASRVTSLREALPQSLDAARAAEMAFRSLRILENSLHVTGTALTGLGGLDAVLGGLRAGTLTVFAGHSMSGKEALAYQLAVRAAIDESRVLLFACGTDAAEAATRILSAQARVNIRHLHSGMLHKSDWACIEDAAERLSTLDIRICGKQISTIDEVVELSRRTFDGCTRGLIVLCGCEFMNPPWRLGRVAEAAAVMRELARELNVPVAMTVEYPQFDVTPEARESSYQGVFDRLGQLSESAENIVFIDKRLDGYWREDPTAPPPNCARAVVDGGVSGGRSIVELAYVPEYLRFLSLEEDSDFR